jgi:hypothetical protein
MMYGFDCSRFLQEGESKPDRWSAVELDRQASPPLHLALVLSSLEVSVRFSDTRVTDKDDLEEIVVVGWFRHLRMSRMRRQREREEGGRGKRGCWIDGEGEERGCQPLVNDFGHKVCRLTVYWRI